MSDPLSLLREYTIQKKPIVFKDKDGKDVPSLENAEKIFFDTTSFKKDTKTALKKKGIAANPTNPTAHFHSLDSLILLIQNRDTDNFNYIKTANELAVQPISFIEKKGFLDYLTGVTNFHDHVEYADAGKPTSGSAAGAPAEQTKRTISAMADQVAVKSIVSRERVLRTKISVLKGPKSFSDIHKKGVELLSKKKPPSQKPNSTPGKTDEKAKQRPNPSIPTPSKVTPAHPYSTPRPQLSKEKRIPIIVVPAAMTALLTMYNIKDFLERQQYANSNEIKESGIKKPTLVTIKRQKTPTAEPIIYHVVDSVDRFKPEDWDRIVCILTNGAAWQFRGWKWQTPAEIFHQVKGFFVKYADDKPKDTVAGWNVAMLNIHRNKRHADKATVSEFWDSLDAYVATAKPFLMP